MNCKIKNAVVMRTLQISCNIYRLETKKVALYVKLETNSKYDRIGNDSAATMFYSMSTVILVGNFGINIYA